MKSARYHICKNIRENISQFHKTNEARVACHVHCEIVNRCHQKDGERLPDLSCFGSWTGSLDFNLKKKNNGTARHATLRKSWSSLSRFLFYQVPLQPRQKCTSWLRLWTQTTIMWSTITSLLNSGVSTEHAQGHFRRPLTYHHRRYRAWFNNNICSRVPDVAWDSGNQLMRTCPGLNFEVIAA